MRPGPIAFLAALLMSTAINAQTVNLYSFSATNGGTLDPMSGAVTLIGPNVDDAASAVTNIGFNFNYEGTDYSQFSVNSNGAMRLGGTVITAFNIDNISDASNNPKLAPFVADAQTTATGNVTTVLTGVAPNQIRMIQWNTEVYSFPIPPIPNCLFQVWLYEGSNVIEFRYAAGTPTGGSSFWWTGISGAAGTNYINVRPGFVGSTTDATRLQAWPGAGTVFTFAPPEPCATPAPGNTLASATSGCPGFSTSLSLQNSTPGSGVGYQWESSPNGMDPWGTIGGATSATYNTGTLSATTHYRCGVTCSTGPSTVYSNPIEITVSAPAPTYYVYNGMQFIEDFGSWGNRCSTADVPSSGNNHWANTPAFGAGTWRRSNTTTVESGWDGVGQAGGTTGTTMSGGANQVTVVQPAARFRNNFGAVAGTLDFHVDMSAGTGAELLRFEYINSGGAGTLGVWISTDGGANFAQIGSTLGVTNPPFNTWVTREFTIGSTSATTVIRLRGTPGSGNNIGVDNFRIIPAATCEAPTGAVAAVTGPGAVDVSWTCASCTGTYFVEYGPTGFTLGTGTVAGPFAGSPASISSIANGNYQAYVRQDCGVDGLSSNAGPAAFSIVAGDFCDSAVDLEGFVPTGGSINAIQVTNSGASNQFNSASCAASTPGADKVYFHDVEPGDTFGFIAQALFGTSVMSLSYGGTCPGENPIACRVGGGYFAGSTDEVPITWTNTTCTTQRVYFVIDANTGAGTGNVALWGYTYTPAATSCQVVTGLAAQVTSLSTATISWDATCSGDVIVEYGPAGFTPGTGATANGGTAVPVSGTSTSLTGLGTGVPYDVYVRQDCGNDDFSANSAALSFTITPGENCAVAIDLANEFAPLIASTAGATNDTPTLSCGAAGGGDLVYFISVPDGATINFEAFHDYNAIVEVSYGNSCPGTLLTCVAGLEQYSWTNTTGEAQNVYWLQDGTNSGDFLLSWDLQDPCATDSDGDGVADCLDECPGGPEPGTPCNDGNSGTTNDVITEDCLCEGTPVTCSTVTLELRSDDGSQVSWEILSLSNAVVCDGGGYPVEATLITENCCLPDGCYRLRVMDSAGDGFGTTGGYQLRTLGSDPTNIRIIDNLGNFTNITPNGSLSAIGNGPSTFCFPFASDPKPLFQHRDKLDFVSGQYLISEEVAAVSAQWLVGDQTDDGYEFWIFDPNGSYSYRRFRNHATSDGFANVGATRACHMKINNWFASQAAPSNVMLNVRIRPRVNGVNGPFGAAYRFKIDPARAACPLTKLNDLPGNQFESCDQARNWGSGNWIHARPVSGANKYQWRFTNGDGFLRVLTTNTYFLQLNWTASPLVAGGTYDVEVRASKNNGVSYCTDAVPPALAVWGDICTLTINGSNAQGGGAQLALDGNTTNVAMFPNPNQGDHLWLNIDGIDANVTTVSVDFFDLAGHRAVARVIPAQGDHLRTMLDLQGELAAGVYIIHIVAGDQIYTERLVVAD
jgi:hypothetical protein